MDKFAYKNFYDKVGKLNGWDFSRLKVVCEGEQWDFYQEVVRKCKKSDILLDIGTGGGERLVSITEAAFFLVGIDQSAGMIDTAKANGRKSNKSNVRFFQMDAEVLAFPDGFFNVISCRHAPFSAKEAARVLANSGIFLTQQVSEGDKLNLKQAFNRGQEFGTEDGVLRDRYLSELREAGFTDIQVFEYDAVEYYETYEDLLFLLKHTPIVPDFGECEQDFETLDQFIKEYQTAKGIQTNSKRFMITAR